MEPLDPDLAARGARAALAAGV
ncbi:MAG: hypothetical protein JWQ18_1323, partial [Conexibacter sp.]|nr:hypothetical protein [Conexibacter sp.]